MFVTYDIIFANVGTFKDIIVKDSFRDVIVKDTLAIIVKGTFMDIIVKDTLAVIVEGSLLEINTTVIEEDTYFKVVKVVRDKVKAECIMAIRFGVVILNL